MIVLENKLGLSFLSAPSILHAHVHTLQVTGLGLIIAPFPKKLYLVFSARLGWASCVSICRFVV